MRKIYRSRNKRMIAGVCGGLGEYLHVDETVIRLIYVLLSFMSMLFPGILVYIVAMIIIPQED